MAKKKFEEEPFNPLAAELLRDATLQARRRGKGESAAPAPQPAPEKIVDIQPRPRAAEVFDDDDLERPEPVRPNMADRLTRGRNAQASRPSIPGPTKRYRVSEEEDYELENFVLQLRRRSNTKVSLGMLNRVSNGILMQALPELIAEIDAYGPIHQPPKNDALQYGEFEEAWGNILERALRRRRVPR